MEFVLSPVEKYFSSETQLAFAWGEVRIMNANASNLNIRTNVAVQPLYLAWLKNLQKLWQLLKQMLEIKLVHQRIMFKKFMDLECVTISFPFGTLLYLMIIVHM